MTRTDHIVVRDGTCGRDAYAVECLHCGTVQRFATPIAVNVYLAAARAFERDHKRCQKEPTP